MNSHQLMSDSPNPNTLSLSKLPEMLDTEDGIKQSVLKVFLVEDSAHVRELLLDFLQVSGEVEIVGFADTEAQSVAAILANPVDAVIVDLKLREGGGMGVIEKLRKADLHPRPTIIVFTNHPFPEIKRRAMQLGADYFFDKSADYDSVRATLQALRAVY
jgi:DNA-binding NarL/FixJ family response regulator